MVNIRKLVTVVEEILTDGGRPAKRPVRKVATVAVIENPFAGKFVEDLTPLIDAGEELGALLAKKATEALGAPAESYGKAAIVGEAGAYTRAPPRLPLVCPRAPDGHARGDGAVPPPRRGPGLRLRRFDRPPAAHAARVRVHVARADRAPVGAGRCDAHAEARDDGPRPAAPQPRLLRQGVGDPRPPLGRAVDPGHRRRMARGGVRADGRAPPRARTADERGDRGAEDGVARERSVAYTRITSG